MCSNFTIDVIVMKRWSHQVAPLEAAWEAHYLLVSKFWYSQLSHGNRGFERTGFPYSLGMRSLPQTVTKVRLALSWYKSQVISLAVEQTLLCWSGCLKQRLIKRSCWYQSLSLHTHTHTHTQFWRSCFWDARDPPSPILRLGSGLNCQRLFEKFLYAY